MTVNIGIIGGGNISQTHARAVKEIDGTKLVAVCGTNAEKTQLLAKPFDCAVYGDLSGFLKHQPMEIVLIGSPPGLHAEQGIQAARSGLHVLTEKPIDVNTQNTDALISECEKAGVKLGVFFQDRTAPDIRKLKEVIDRGRLGKPLLVSAHIKWFRPSEYYKGSRWRGVPEFEGGGALISQGIHTVDLILWLMGDVTCVSGKVITGLHQIDVEDTAVATLEFANGAIGTVEAATSAYPGYARRIEITGSEGTIILENDNIIAADLRTPMPELVSRFSGNDSERSTTAVISDVSGHRRIIEDFVLSIKENRRPLCDGREGRRSIEMIQAIYESSKTARFVSLPFVTAGLQR
jgi:predicted dehydrogenase